MSIKVKSILSKQLKNYPSDKNIDNTPVRGDISRLSSGSGLKNLSQERNVKKLNKLRESSIDKIQLKAGDLMESLNNLQQQYENMRMNSTVRTSLKRSIIIKGVPHTSINLNPRASMAGHLNGVRQANSLNTTLHSRNHSLSSNTQKELRVISIGTECQKKKKVQKKKGIYISLKDNREKVRGATLTLC